MLREYFCPRCGLVYERPEPHPYRPKETCSSCPNRPFLFLANDPSKKIPEDFTADNAIAEWERMLSATP